MSSLNRVYKIYSCKSVNYFEKFTARTFFFILEEVWNIMDSCKDLESKTVSS